MSDRKIINRIKNTSERILPGFITGEGEFIFNHTQGGSNYITVFFEYNF